MKNSECDSTKSTECVSTKKEVNELVFKSEGIRCEKEQIGSVFKNLFKDVLITLPFHVFD